MATSHYALVYNACTVTIFVCHLSSPCHLSKPSQATLPLDAPPYSREKHHFSFLKANRISATTSTSATRQPQTRLMSVAMVTGSVSRRDPETAATATGADGQRDGGDSGQRRSVAELTCFGGKTADKT